MYLNVFKSDQIPAELEVLKLAVSGRYLVAMQTSILPATFCTEARLSLSNYVTVSVVQSSGQRVDSAVNIYLVDGREGVTSGGGGGEGK